ncbi:MAG: PQQ-binding-like beta-propeller repeat protein [Flavobacteriales bacterium]|nr:PQQ-binding-like beta-propeller repeat protein [Flavobacteriales bacterium]
MMLLLAGCKKDEDKEAPRVEILTPAEGAVLSIPDTLNVRVRCSDDRSLRSVTVTLTNSAGIPIAPGATAELSGTQMEVELTIVVTDETVTTGNGLLTARASDGFQDGRAFRDVALMEAPLRRRGLFITTLSGSTTQIHRLDQSGSLSLASTLPYANQLMDSHSASDRLVVAGSVNGPLVTFRTEPFGQVWQSPNLNFLPVPFHSGLHMGTDKVVYVATVDERVQGYQVSTGWQSYNAALQSGWRVGHMVLTGDRLATEQYAVSGTDRRLTVYNRASGTALDQYTLDLELAGMHALDDIRVVLLGKRGADGVVQQRDLSNGNIQEPLVLSGQPIRAACKITESTYALLAGNEVLRYTHPGSLATTLTTLSGTTMLTYDAWSGLIHVAAGNLLYSIDPLSGSTVATHTLPGPIQGVRAVLNR